MKPGRVLRLPRHRSEAGGRHPNPASLRIHQRLAWATLPDPRAPVGNCRSVRCVDGRISVASRQVWKPASLHMVGKTIVSINLAPEVISPGSFSEERHFYPRVLNAHLHPLVRHLLEMGNERIICRYCHLHPEVDEAAVRNLLTSAPRYFRWGGSDLIHVTTESGLRRVVVIETNSCPSGQKSMPRVSESVEEAGYLSGAGKIIPADSCIAERRAPKANWRCCTTRITWRTPGTLQPSRR